MPRPVDQTEEQLRSQGHKPATETQWRSLMGKIRQVSSVPHSEGSAGAKRCMPGKQCFETPCIDGKKGVIYCNNNGICAGTQYIIDC